MRRLFSWVFLLSVSNFPCVAAFAGSAPNALYVGFNAPGDSAIDVYPLTANAIGQGFAAATDPQSLTIAGGKLYWIDGGQILDLNLDGTGLSVLQTFLDVPTSIAVDFSGERLFAGFNTPIGHDIGVYPLTPDATGKPFAAAADPQSLTVAGGKLYWIDGGQIFDANLDGTDLSVLQTFLDVPTSIGVDFSGERLFAGFNTPIGHDIGVYPLTPDATGKPFAAATDPQSLTVAGGKLYWIDGAQVLDANLDGADLSILQTFAMDPTSIAVSVAPPPVPEPSTWTMILSGFVALGLASRLRNRERKS